MTNLLFLILGLLLGSFIGVLCLSLTMYQKKEKRFRKEIKRLYELQTSYKEENAEIDCSGEELQ